MAGRLGWQGLGDRENVNCLRFLGKENAYSSDKEVSVSHPALRRLPLTQHLAERS